MLRKSKKSRVFTPRWIPCTTLIGRKTLTPAGDKLDVELRTLHEDLNYDFDNYRPVIVYDFSGNESDGNESNDFGPDDGNSDSDSEDE